MNLLNLFEHLARGTHGVGRGVDRLGDDRGHERTDPAHRGPGEVGKIRNQRRLRALDDFGFDACRKVSFWAGRQRRHCGLQRFRLGHLLGPQFGYWGRDLFSLRLDRDRPIKGLGNATAMTHAVDLVLSLNGKPRTGELLLSPKNFGGLPNLVALDRDRGVGLEFGALTHGVCGGSPLVGSLAAPQGADQRQQAQQNEERNRDQPQQKCAGARQRVVVHGDPPSAEAPICGCGGGCTGVRKRALVVDDGSVQSGCLALTRPEGVVEILSGVGKKLIGG